MLRRHTPWIALWLLAAAPALAQESVAEPGAEQTAEQDSDAQDDVFFESVDVNVINVPVYVNDKEGNPITGLTRDDFEIYEDKRPVKISNFYAVESGRAVAGPRVDDAPPTEGERVMAPSLPLLDEEQRLHLIVYIDNFNIRPFNRNRVFRRLREFLNSKLTREDRVMLVTYDRSLHIRYPFTSNPDQVAAAMFELETLTGHALHYDSEHRSVLREIDEAEGVREADWRVRQFAESRFNDMAFTIDAMKDMIDSLAGLPGRKALLHVSDGMPMIVGEDLFNALHFKFQDTTVLSQMREFDLSRRFQRLADQANANGITFYTIDAAGLRVARSASAETERYSSVPGLYTMMDSIVTQNLQSPLLFLADQTGGTAIINTNDVGDGLERIANDFNNYYVLGYVPSHSGDGRFHRIEVKLKEREKGVRIRHRSGYRDKTVQARMSDTTMSTLRYGFDDNPLDIALQVGEQIDHEQGNVVVDLLVLIPIGKVTLVAREDFHEARVKLFVAAMDEDGGVAPVQEQAVPIRIPADRLSDALEQRFHFRTRLLMRPGDHRVAVGIRDELGAETSFVSRSIRVGAG